MQAAKFRFKRGAKLLVWSGILAAASLGGWLVYLKTANRPPDPIAVRIVPVKLDAIENTINESGTVELGSQQILKSPNEGAVDRVLVKVGDSVRFGQQLIVLRNPDRQTLITTQKLEIQKKELSLANNRQKVTEAAEKLKFYQQEYQRNINQRDVEIITKEATKKIDIRQKELALERSKQKLKEAEEKVKIEQAKLKDLEVLDKKGFIPRNELQAQQENIRSAQSELRDAQLSVNTNALDLQKSKIETPASPPPLPKELIDARGNLRDAQLTVSTDIRDIEKLKLDLKKIEQQIQESVVIAPIRGIVLSVIVKDGDGVDRGKDLLGLGDPTQEIVKLQLSTLNAAQVRLGQLARINVIGPNPKIYTGRLQSLSPQASSGEKGGESSSSSQSNKALVPATIKLDTPTRTLIPGSQVNVEIILQQRQNIVALNTEAIQREGEKPFVWVRDAEGKARKRTVTLGLEGLTTVEITSGLQVGEKVVLPPTEGNLEEGAPVKEMEGKPEEKEE